MSLSTFIFLCVINILLSTEVPFIFIVQEVVRNQVLALETDLMDENKKFSYALDRVKKYTEARQEIERKQDMQYQREM